jgi:hypothetical protein
MHLYMLFFKVRLNQLQADHQLNHGQWLITSQKSLVMFDALVHRMPQPPISGCNWLKFMEPPICEYLS